MPSPAVPRLPPGCLAALLGFLLLAGCLSPPASIPTTPSVPVPAVVLPARDLAWNMQGCVFVAAVLQVPAALVQPLVPPGFRVMHAAEFALEGASSQPVPTPPAPDGKDGNIGVEAFQCESGSGLNGSVPGMTYASFYTGVEPPASLKVAGTPFYFVKWDTLVPDLPRQDLLRSYGLPVHNGTATASLGVAQQSLAKVQATLDFGSRGAYSFDATALTPFPDDRCGLIEYTQVPAGLARWDMKCSFKQGGVGPLTVNVPASSWLGKITGGGAQQGLGFIGRVDFHTGMLHLPATNSTAVAPV
ncbi:MAG TPA: hypothetical protein VM286_03580 [Candidatus Thermoplasmatota archaeon]|nr:hypothetical protein [Candidatus Thermoplasmatota archaeon]